jgi:hypothetical protein
LLNTGHGLQVCFEHHVVVEHSILFQDASSGGRCRSKTYYTRRCAIHCWPAESNLSYKMFKPALPPRLYNIVAEAAFRPLRSSFAQIMLGGDNVPSIPSPSQLLSRRPQSSFNPSPRLLKFTSIRRGDVRRPGRARLFQYPKSGDIQRGSSGDINSTRA